MPGVFSVSCRCRYQLLKSTSSRWPPDLEIFLFDQELLEKTSGQVKEDTVISSNVSLSRLACSGFKDKRSASDVSSSSHAESSRGSSFGKCSGSPARGSSAKRFRGGRGKTPTSSRKGFQK